MIDRTDGDSRKVESADIVLQGDVCVDGFLLELETFLPHLVSRHAASRHQEDQPDYLTGFFVFSRLMKGY